MNRKTFTSIYEKAVLAFPVLGIIIAIGYFLALKNDFEYSIQHFTTDSVWFWVFAIPAAVACALAIVLALLPKKTAAIAIMPIPTPAALFATLFGAVMCVGVLITETKVTPAQIISPVQKVGSLLSVFIALTMALACVKKYRTGLLHKISSILAVLSINATMFACYFDFSQPLNGPVRNVTTIVQAAVLLFLISEMRLSFGLPAKRVTTVLYVLSSCATASLALGFSFGGMLYKIFESNPADPNPALLRLGIYLAVSIFALDRALQLPKITSDPIKEPEANTTKK